MAAASLSRKSPAVTTDDKMSAASAAVALVMALLVAAQAAPSDKMRENFEKCKTESGATPQNLENIGKNGPTTDAEKCFVGCLYREMDLLTKDGNFDLTTAEQAIDNCPHLSKNTAKQAEAKRIIQACASTVTATGVCAAGAQLNACIRDKASAGTFELHMLTMDNLKARP